MATGTGRVVRALAAGTGALLASASIQAAVLFSQAPLDGGAALLATVDGAPDFSGAQNADDFSLAAGSTINGFQWWGTDVDPSHFVVRLFADLVNAPDTFTLLAGAVSKTATAIQADDGSPIFLYEMTVAPLSVSGTSYLSVLSTDPNTPWYWLESNPGPDSFFRGIDGDAWQSLPPDLAIVVLGDRAAVDEPGIALLICVAALGAFVQSRRARRR